MTTAHSYRPVPGAIPVWTFGDKLRKARTLMGDDQKTFAAAIGITAASLAAYETGRATPRFKDAPGLARRVQLYTGVPAQWLLFDDDPNGGDTKKAPTPKGEGLSLPELDSNQQPAG